MPKKTPLKVALHFLKFRPRSVFEVEKKLKSKKFSLPEIKQTIADLKKAGFLNDLILAKLWIENRNLLKPTGQRLLFWELKKLGIEEEIIQKALSEDEMSETDKARKAIKNKIKRYYNLEPQKIRQKMIQFLARRGFNWETIQEVLKNQPNQSP